jgi:outer membrane protein TolC
MWLLSACVLLLLTTTGALEAQPGQSTFSPTAGSVPAGTATTEVRHLTLHNAISMGLRYNLGVIEGEENSHAARAQRLRALSDLLPQVSTGIAENGTQTSRAALGITTSFVPAVIGPFSYSTVQVTLSQTLLSVESIQRLRAARAAEQAVTLTYADTLDVVTLTIGNA